VTPERKVTRQCLVEDKQSRFIAGELKVAAFRTRRCHVSPGEQQFSSVNSYQISNIEAKN
jgi:hypothetical protein